MLNVIYYPVSFILWCWHQVFGLLLGDANAAGWAFAIVFLVFTLRAVLLKPAIHQMRSLRRMQELAPRMRAIGQKYADDRRRQATEMQKEHRAHGVSPLGGCLPALFQIPVFLGLNHVLRNFTQHPDLPNYVFGIHGVHSYLNATLFGAHLGDAIVTTALVAGHGLHHAVWMWQVAPVAIPLMIVAAVATHLTARLSVRRQMTTDGTGTPRSAAMEMISQWIFPLGVLVFGAALPVGLLLYWVSNNIWTLCQQHVVSGRLDRESEEGKRQAQVRRRALAPGPGRKPAPRPRK